VQDDIARAVSSALKVTLLGADKPTHPAHKDTAEVYNLYLQGKYFSARRTKENLQRSVDYFEQALKLDPNHALAWQGLATTYIRQADLVHVPVDEGYRKARQAVDRALALDPNLAEAHALLAWIRRTYDWDWEGADAAARRAFALEPGNATVVRSAGTLASTMGRFEEAVDLGRRAVVLDPLSAVSRLNLGSYATHAGRLDEAEATLRKGIELSPDYPGLYLVIGKIFLMRSKPEAALRVIEQEKDPFWRRQGLALAYHALGRKKEADAALAELLAENKEDTFQIAEVYAFRGEPDKAFEWLERAYARRDGGLAEIKGNPLLKSLETDRRHQAFLEKMRLPLFP
jgi:tetratricopeptide (TPR) repeat protein